MTDLFDTDTADLRALLDGVAAGVTPRTDVAWASIETRLRGEGVAVPASPRDIDTDESIELDVALAAVDGRVARVRRRRAVLAVAAAAIVVTGVVAVLAAERGDQRPADDRDEVYPRLTYVPAGLVDTGASVFEGFATPSSPADAALVLERADGLRSYVVEVRQHFVDAGLAPTEQVDLGDGRIGRRTTVGTPTITWTEQRLAVDISAAGVADGAVDAELVAVARGLRVVREATLATTLQATALPDGFRVAYRGSPAGRLPAAQGHVSFGRMNDLSAPTDANVTGTVFVLPADVPVSSFLGYGEVRTVQGHTGVLTAPDPTGLVGSAQTSVAWSPAPGLVAIVLGTAMSESELLRIAEGMRFVSESTFRAQHPSTGPDLEPSDPAPPATMVAEGTAGAVTWRLSRAGADGCYVLEASAGISQTCGTPLETTRVGDVLTARLDDGVLLVLVAAGDPATVVAEVDEREVARGVAPDAMADGRREQVLAMVVPGDVSSVALRALRADGSELDRTVWQLDNAAPQPTGTADPDALAAAPVLASGTIEGSTAWTLRGGDIPEVVLRADGLVPSGASRPCVALSLGARELTLLLCDGQGQPDSVLGASDAISTPIPRNAVLAFVDESVRSYRLEYEDGREGSVETVAVAGLTGRRAVAFVVGLDEHLVAITPVRADGTAGERIEVDVPGTPQAPFHLGDQRVTFDEGSASTVAPVTTAP